MNRVISGGGTGPVGEGANRCFVCGPANARGLQVRFRLDGDICRGEFTPTPAHAGYDNLTHGGLLFALLDDVMANWLWLQGHACFTAEANIRYHEPLEIGTPVALEGSCDKRRGRLSLMRGQILRLADQCLIASATGKFMLRTDLPPTTA